MFDGVPSGGLPERRGRFWRLRFIGLQSIVSLAMAICVIELIQALESSRHMAEVWRGVAERQQAVMVKQQAVEQTQKTVIDHMVSVMEQQGSALHRAAASCGTRL